MYDICYIICHILAAHCICIVRYEYDVISFHSKGFQRKERIRKNDKHGVEKQKKADLSSFKELV